MREKLWNNYDKVFKNGPREICGRQRLKNLKVYGLFKETKGSIIWRLIKILCLIISFLCNICKQNLHEEYSQHLDQACEKNIKPV